MTLSLVSRTKSFGGWVEFYRHSSEACASEMRFSVYRPPQAESGHVPILYWLSGLTCTEENFITKAGAERLAAELGLLLVVPDTSPRLAGIEGEATSWDLGLGAGFYLNATAPKWAKHYRMYDYVTVELPALIKRNFPVLPDRESIFGHSMGGHGALVAALREPERYQSVSAFAPICAPSLCGWGRKAFTNYLGDDVRAWREWDTHMLIVSSKKKQPFLIDQGTDDKFLREQLMPGVLKEVCGRVGYPLELRMQTGYDHSYYFIASFIEDHLRYHAKALLGA